MAPRRSVTVALVLTSAAAVTTGSAVLVATTRGEHAAASTRPLSAAPVRTPSPAVIVRVNGAPVPAVGPATVQDALTAAGVRPHPGRYIAIVSQRLLGPDGHPGQVYVNGHLAGLRTRLTGGERVTVRPGADVVEPTQTVPVSVAPPVQSPLYVGARAGLARVVRGAMSHERVSERILRRPKVGHLERPGAVALTFDDGPSRYYTRHVLALLHHAHAHATFCMIGKQAAARPWLVREVAAAGDALCDHTWDHDLLLRTRPHGQMVLDVHRGRHAIVRATHGRSVPMFFRAPGGSWSPRLEAVARQQGMTPLHWTVDTEDWTRPGVRAILHNVYRELRPGGVILMHDGGGNRRETLAALRILLHRLPRMGYHFVLPRPEPAAHVGGA